MPLIMKFQVQLKANAIKNHNHIFMLILTIPCHNQSKSNIIILYASINSKALNINHSLLITHVTYAHVIAHIQSQFLCSYSNMLNTTLYIFSCNFKDPNTNQTKALKQLSNNNLWKSFWHKPKLLRKSLVQKPKPLENLFKQETS